MKLKEVLLPGHSYRHRFQKPDGTFFEVETTQEEYRSLGEKNPTNPIHPIGRWIASYEFYDIPLGCYAMETPDKVLMNFDGRQGTCRLEFFGDGTVTPEFVAKVDEQYSLN